ncbi:MAG: hypothetical protein ACI32E_00550 [Bacilli bacterium]
MKETRSEELWRKFLKSGHINDYLNYKLYLRKKEEHNYETSSFERRDYSQDH